MKTLICVTILAATWQGVAAQTIDPYYAGCYTWRSVGTPAGVQPYMGGLNFVPGNPNEMFVGGAESNGSGAIYRIGVVRDANNAIVGFLGTATYVASAPYDDGGLAVGPLNTLFVTAYPTNVLMQIPEGATVPGLTTDLTALGVASSVGSCQFVPAGFPGEGRLKTLSYTTGRWYDLAVSNPVNGVFTITRPNNTEIQLGSVGPEGVVFIGAGNPGFPRNACAVCEFGAARIETFELDGNGDPIVATRRILMSGLAGAEGGVRDPLTGSFLFSSAGSGNQVLVVEGFNLDCRANFNADCSVDFFDYLDFLSAFTTSSPEGDFNLDGVVDFFDYLDFVQAFSGGC